MRNLPLEPHPDHVGRLARSHDPVRAVSELIWNSIDAEADNVTVTLELSAVGAVQTVIVEDDGHGISSDEVESTFGRIGGSWKAMSATSKNGKRTLHGKLGEGRLRAFALGTRVRWSSESLNTVNEPETVTIEGQRDSGHVFQWDARPSSATMTGTVVTAENEGESKVNGLLAPAALSTLRAHFAPALLNDPEISITYNRMPLDPKDEIADDTTVMVQIARHPERPAAVRIIEWRSGKHRTIYFGRDDRHFVFEAPGTEAESNIPFSAYVTWPNFTDESLSMLGLHDQSDDVAAEVWRAALKTVREHFAARRRAKRRVQVQQWIDSGAYPYEGEATSEPERAERALFDVVSSAVVPQVSKGPDGAKVVLRLVQDALRTDPENLGLLLAEYTALTEEERATLTQLLTETTLASVIRAANLVTSRNKFLVGLENLLFHPEDSKSVRERDHLHKILERELWIFGERYHLMSSERSLTELLRSHLKLQGLPTAGVEPVLRWDEKSGRTDLHLAAKFQEHDRIRHLVVELKAPKITAGRAERDQIEDYLNAVAENQAFASDTAVWDFILLVNDYDDVVKNSIKRERGQVGLLFEAEKKPDHPQVRAYVRRWRDVIDENRQKLAFLTRTLEHDPSLPAGIAFLREHYGDLLPADESEAVREEGDPDRDEP